MKLIVYVFAMFFLFQLQAQEKNEQERRIKKKEIPSVVKEWINDAYETKRKVKWFYQTDGDKKVYEAKLSYKNKKHSVEIKPNGEVVNIEIQLDLDEIHTKARQTILAYFEANYDKFNIKKIQIEYTGSNDQLEDLIDEEKLDEAIKISYEIEFYGKNKEEDELWEGLFDAAGNLLDRRKIMLKATDNLDF